MPQKIANTGEVLVNIAVRAALLAFKDRYQQSIAIVIHSEEDKIIIFSFLVIPLSIKLFFISNTVPKIIIGITQRIVVAVRISASKSPRSLKNIPNAQEEPAIIQKITPYKYEDLSERFENFQENILIIIIPIKINKPPKSICIFKISILINASNITVITITILVVTVKVIPRGTFLKAIM